MADYYQTYEENGTDYGTSDRCPIVVKKHVAPPI